MISQINREDIAQELREYCQKFNSQNRAAAAIGIAPATVSAILNNDWALVSEAMFIKIADAIGYEASSWQAIETKVALMLQLLIHEDDDISSNIIGFCYDYLHILKQVSPYVGLCCR